MIEVRDWHKHFGKNHVLRGVNCRVETGEAIVMLGASGSGKSTFLRTLNFLEHAEQGTLILDDMTLDMTSVRKKDILAVRRQTAMVFQSYNLFRHKTALENVMEALVVVKKMNKDEAKRLAEEELCRVGLAGRPDELLPPSAFRRPAAACGHCPRTGDPAQGDPVRRAYFRFGP